MGRLEAEEALAPTVERTELDEARIRISSEHGVTFKGNRNGTPEASSSELVGRHVIAV